MNSRFKARVCQSLPHLIGASSDLWPLSLSFGCDLQLAVLGQASVSVVPPSSLPSQGPDRISIP